VAHLAGSSKLLRAMNSSAALALLLDRGRLTRGELRELTGLSKPTVSEALRRLVDAELATMVGHVTGGPGPNAEVYAVNPDASYVVAVSVHETVEPDRQAIAAALCDLTATIRARSERMVDFEHTDPVEAVASVVEELTAEAGIAGVRLDHVQIGVAGAYDPGTRTIHHVDMPGFDRPGLVADLADRIGTDVEVDNDVNLAAVAERRHGNAANVDSFAVLWLGEGLGLAIDLGGRLLRGARGGAGEIGYMPLFDPSRSSAAPGATPPSDLQDLIGGDAVLALAVRYGHDGRTPERAVAAAVGDPAFLAALADRVAVGLAPVVAVLDPQLVVLAGPVAKAGGVALRDAVVAAMRRVAPLETTVEVTTVDDDPVLLGGLDAGLAAVRGRLLATLQRPAA
jgi:predicted NBD/HSP70 family sugar kinase